MSTLIISVDPALRNTGIFTYGGSILLFELIKYKEPFSLEDFSSINNHRKFWYNFWDQFLKKIFSSNFSSVIFLAEADTFGVRRGGYKVKELMTLVRYNITFSFFDISVKHFSFVPEIKFVPASRWKKDLFGSPSLKKKEYREKIYQIANIYNINVKTKLLRHDVLDAIAIALWHLQGY